jgi:hypothetical protein
VLIVVLVNTKSTSTTSGTTALTQPINSTPVESVGPIGLPEKFANCISTYKSILSFEAGFKR